MKVGRYGDMNVGWGLAAIKAQVDNNTYRQLGRLEDYPALAAWQVTIYASIDIME